MNVGIFDKLQEEMIVTETKSSNYAGHFYRISDALLILVCGVLCGLKEIGDISQWSKSGPTRKFMAERFSITKIMCRSQLYEILGRVNEQGFQDRFAKWMKYVVKDLTGKTVSIDGKTICGTEKLSRSNTALHIASAVVSESNLVIATTECTDKLGGEVKAFRELVALLDLKGAMVVADALHCKTESAKEVLNAGADYLLVVKDNNPILRAEIESCIQSENTINAHTVELNGGRYERRTGYINDNISALSGKENWAGIACMGAIRREVELKKHKETPISEEWHLYISSRPLTPEELLKYARLEWRVESMHWLLDVHYLEDKTHVRDMDIQILLNTARKIALNLIRIVRDNYRSPRTALSSIMRENLFDVDKLSDFIDLLSSSPELLDH